jgi:hypothetical protein
MSFPSPKTVQAPPVPPPIAVPEVSEEVEDIAKRKRPRGRRETFLTGDLIPGLEEGNKRFFA